MKMMRPMQEQIIQALKVKPVIYPQQEISKTIDFMKEYLIKYPFIKSYILGISGGQDSTLVGKLAQMAMEEMRDETKDSSYRFIAVRLPYGVQRDEDDAQHALDFIQADQVVTINIKGAVDQMEAALAMEGIKISDFNKGNIKARQRMIAQYALAGHFQGAVLGTDHAAESVTGFFTKYGDGSADLMPIWRLNKRQGRQLLAYLNAPESLYNKLPVADLEDERPMMSDELALGVTYEDIDDYLEGKQIEDWAAEKIESWYHKTEHKRKLPITIFDDFWR